MTMSEKTFINTCRAMQGLPPMEEILIRTEDLLIDDVKPTPKEVEQYEALADMYNNQFKAGFDEGFARAIALIRKYAEIIDSPEFRTPEKFRNMDAHLMNQVERFLLTHKNNQEFEREQEQFLRANTGRD